MDNHFTFTPPPECPVFRPTIEEFRDPLEYIDQIKHIAMKSGICKIIPPDGWRPPFSVNVKTFQFTPRVQKLYELEAQSRVKLNFMTKLSQFVRLQGNDKLKIPNINGQHLDLYKLHKIVNELGGYEHVTANKLWAKLGIKLGYKNSNHVYSLRNHYEKILLPYDIMIDNTKEFPSFNSLNIAKHKPVLHPSTTKKRKSLLCLELDASLIESSPELKKLQFVGPGPFMINNKKTEKTLQCNLLPKRKGLSDYVCKVCGKGDREDRLLICDNDDCQESFHCDCLTPPIVQVPKQSWKCQNCVLNVLNIKPVEYGFPSSSTTYSLHDFGRSADKFKANYFGIELHELVPCSTVEKEFWRILQSFNDDVIVEYGADIHSSHQGSGFPTLENITNGRCTRNNGEPNFDLALKYAKEPWNLNILPVNKRSILSYIRGNIDGMKVPWCYVGMVFSSFCWHIEDHWSFSINYLHWGEPKTWYGVSSENAVDFEAAMKKQAPELFENHQDLLHHITTTMNPNLLQKEGVPVYRTDQHAGQFVVTFPRAYHTGFNQGFNFAEAVNFCPGNWLPMGRACVSNYAQLQRHCVFSHEELLCTIAEAALLQQELEDNGIDDDQLASKYPLMAQLSLPRSQISIDTNIRRLVHSELEQVLAEEKSGRGQLKALGIDKCEQKLFENMSDDERACSVCQTTCFHSAIQCLCRNDELKAENGQEIIKRIPRIVCFRHIDNICGTCSHSACTFLYRFQIVDIENLVSGLEVRLQDFNSWATAIKCQLAEGRQGDKRCTLEHLQLKLEEGAECGFEGCDEFARARGLLTRGFDITNVCRFWLKAIRDTEDCSKATDMAATVPKSVLLDCAKGSNRGSMGIKNVNVACISEENLDHMLHTLTGFPLQLPCTEFQQMCSRLLSWRQESHSLMASVSVNPTVLLPQIVQLFEESKRLFPGWTSFANERSCLILIGKSLQWLVRIRECEDTVKSGKTAHLSQEDNVLSLPRNLVTDSTIVEMIKNGESILSSLTETIAALADIGLKFLSSIRNSIEQALSVLSEVVSEINRIREESAALSKQRALSSQLLSSLKKATEHCLCIGVRIKELDDARVRIYKSCVEVLISKSSNFVALQHATQLMDLGSALFSEAVLDRENSQLNQKHQDAKSQLSMITCAVQKLKTAFTGCTEEHGFNSICTAGCKDSDFLKMLLPRHYSHDETLNQEWLVQSSTHFRNQWLSSVPSDSLVVSLMTLYQSLMVEELNSLEKMVSITSAKVSCCVCNKHNVYISAGLGSYCSLCAPRSKRPTIADLAQLNKLLKQCPNIVSVYGIALQALSKRTITWLESLVTVIRLNAKYLARFYSRLKVSKISIPKCIKEIFTKIDEFNEKKLLNIRTSKDIFSNLKYLARVGRCLEVNVDSYLAIIAVLTACVATDLPEDNHVTTIVDDDDVSSII